MVIFKHVFLPNEPTVFRQRFGPIHRTAIGLELWKRQFCGGFVLENEPTGTPQVRGYSAKIRRKKVESEADFVMLLPVRITPAGLETTRGGLAASQAARLGFGCVRVRRFGDLRSNRVRGRETSRTTDGARKRRQAGRLPYNSERRAALIARGYSSDCGHDGTWPSNGADTASGGLML